MSAYVTWFVIGFALLVAELLTGTFYLLVLAIAAGVAGVAAAMIGLSPGLPPPPPPGCESSCGSHF